MSIPLDAGQSVVLIEQDKDANKPYRFQLGRKLSTGDALEADGVRWTADAGITISDTTNDDTDAVVWFSGGLPKTWYSAVGTWITKSGASDQFVVRIFIKEDAEVAGVMGSALFPNKFSMVAQMRRDRLLLLGQNHLGGVDLSNDYIWSKVQAAEAELAHSLRVRFSPTTFFPEQPTQAELDDLAGAPWDIDEGYDYDPALYTGDRWGFIQTDNAPIVSVDRVRMVYPAGGMSFDIPNEWLQVSKKYGHIQIVPMSTSSAGMSPFMLQTIGSGRVIPNMIRVKYVAGLVDAVNKFPELVDVVKKMAVLKILEDCFLPQSGSISADGLSQSVSVDMGKYEDSIDRTVNGGAGANGGLKAAIHGIRLAVC